MCCNFRIVLLLADAAVKLEVVADWTGPSSTIRAGLDAQDVQPTPPVGLGQQIVVIQPFWRP